jgi:hypothetical protein
MAYNFLKDEAQLELFLSEVRKTWNLEKDEVIFIALMVRNKYLTAEEKKTIDLSRANIVNRQIVDTLDLAHVKRAIQKMEVSEGVYLDKSGNPIPAQCLIPYFTYNPVSPVDAFAKTQKQFVDYLMELDNRSGDKANTYSRLQRLDRAYWTNLQHAFSRKMLLDFDFDLPDRELGFQLTDEFMTSLRSHGAETFRVQTRSGFHVLVNRKTINYNYNVDLQTLSNKALAAFGPARATKESKPVWEIEKNENEGIPCPGCQAKDYLITVG